MKILNLTLTKKWFDLIILGDKTSEYREVKPHWVKRLENKEYKTIHFVNGYGKHRPNMDVALQSINIIDGSAHKPLNGETLEDDKFYYKIDLGDVTNVRNLK